MEFVEILKDDFDPIYKIMEEAFPKEERRKEEGQKRLFDEEIYSIVSNKEKTVFIAFWKMDKYVYIEHFAAAKTERGRGTGSNFLRTFLNEAGRPVVLEVEPPLNETSKRRIAFYEREGFVLNGYHYIQPSMGEGRSPVELKIMTYPQKVTEEEFEDIKTEIYSKVYKFNS